MNDNIEIERYVSEIKSFGTRVSQLAQAFRKDINDQDRIFDHFSPDHWRRAVYGDALIRLRQITENNFLVIESLSLVATARYIFELSVWLSTVGKRWFRNGRLARTATAKMKIQSRFGNIQSEPENS